MATHVCTQKSIPKTILVCLIPIKLLSIYLHKKKKRTKKGTKLYFFFLIYLYVKPNSVYNWFKPMAIKVSTIQLDMMVKVSDPLVGEAAAGTTVALETGTVGAMEDVA